MADYIVTSPLVMARDDAGAFVYLYQGAVVPDHVNKDDLARLKDEGHVASLGGATEPEGAKLPAAGRVEPLKK